MDLDRLFHPFDIRGPYPDLVNEQLAFKIGRTLTGSLLVAGDNRTSTPNLASALIAGFTGSVTYLGETSTPLFSYSLIRGDYDFGVMVTASHIADSQNGFKILKKGGTPLDEGEMLNLKEEVSKKNGETQDFSLLKPDQNLKNKLLDSYIKDLVAKFEKSDFARIGKVVFDSGGTAVTPILSALLPRLTLDYLHLTTPRGLNPLEENSRINIKAAVLKAGAVLGIIFDGDGDRAVFVDDRGNLISPTYILGSLARIYPKVVLDMRAGLAARTTKTVLTPSWSQNLKFTMLADPTVMMGGETSGHVVFREWDMIDDGVFVGLKFLWGLDKNFLATLRASFFELEETNFSRDENYPIVLSKIADYYRSRGDFVSIIDGVTVWGSNFKFNLRPSLTESMLRLNLEGVDEKTAREQYEEISSLI